MPRSPFLRRFLPALVIGLLVAAAASAQPRQQRSLSDRLARSVPDLSPQQKADLDALAATGERSPALAWSLAADVRDVLTPSQIEALTSHAEPGARRPTRGRSRALGARGADRARRGGRRDARRTDSQREAARGASRERRQALVDEFRAGSIDASTFQARSERLREEGRAARRASMTPEQRERADAAQARREEARSAREAALGLTPAQKEALEAIRLERIRTSPGAPDLRPYLGADGQLDRSALREARRARREATAPEREALRERAESVLTADQKATIAVHRALTRAGRGGRAAARADAASPAALGQAALLLVDAPRRQPAPGRRWWKPSSGIRPRGPGVP